MTTAQMVAMARATWKAIQWRIRLALRRTGKAGVMLLVLGTCGAGCARFDPFWLRVNDAFGIVPSEEGGEQ